jgi:hypothetical protein
MTIAQMVMVNYVWQEEKMARTKPKKLKVLLVGGLVEKDEMKAMARALRETGYKPFTHMFPCVEGTPNDPEDLLRTIDRKKPDIVFSRKNFYPNCRVQQVEERIGTVYIPAHMIELGIPVVGSDGDTIRDLRNKNRCDIALRDAGLPFCNDFILFDPRQEGKRPYGLVINHRGFEGDELSDPFQKHPVLFIKPNAGGRSEGITDANVTHSLEELIARSQELGRELDGLLIASPFYPGVEYTVGVLGNNKRVLLPVEVCQVEGYSANRILPTGVKRGGIPTGKVFIRSLDDSALVRKLNESALATVGELSVSDYTRIDFRVDGEGQLHMIDINGIPGIKRDESYIPMACEMAFSGKRRYSVYGRMVSSIVVAACQRYGMPCDQYPTLYKLNNQLLENV